MELVDSFIIGMPLSGRALPGIKISKHVKITALASVAEEVWPAILVEAPPLNNLTINATEGGLVTIPGEGVFAYEHGTVVNLVATPEAGYYFVEWTGDISTVDDPNAASTTVTMNGGYSITAIFAAGGVVVGGIQGYVHDKETGYPILGVLVSFQLSSTRTDAQGYYEIPDIPGGTYAFTYTAFGYKIAERSATIEDEWATVDVDLTPGEGPEPEPERANLWWVWTLLGVGGAAVVGARIKKVLDQDRRK